MIYLLLAAGLFMGWSLGTVDSAGAFGTAVATRVVRYKTAVIIIAVFVVAGAFIGGSGNIGALSLLAESNEVIASGQEVQAASDAGSLASLQLRSAIKAAIIFACAGLTVFTMSWLKFPVSANQAITGAIIGWGLFSADYSNPNILAVNLPMIGRFAATWILNPLGAGIVSFILAKTLGRIMEKRFSSLSGYDNFIKAGYLIAGALGSFSLGLNSSANVTALYFDSHYTGSGQAANLLTDPTLAAGLGGIAIAVGALTYSKKIMMTVGGGIADISQMDGFIVIIAMSLTVVIMGKMLGIPVSTSQAMVGAVIGAGLTRGVGSVHFGVIKKIGLAWVTSPTVAGVLAYSIAFLTSGYFS